MTHADTLRHMAADEPFGFDMVLEHPNKTSLLAGAAAIDTLTKVRKVADLLDQMAEDNRQAATQLDWAAPGAIGREHAYTKAAQFVREAIGGNHE